MTISQNDVIRATAAMERAGVDDVQNVYYVTPVSVAAQTQQQLRDDIADWLEDVYDSLISHLTDDVTFNEIQLFNVTDTTPEPSVNWPTLTVGGAAAEVLPEGVAALAIGRTGVSKRIGKKYFGIFTEAGLDNGVWLASLLTALGLAAADWIAPFTGASGATWDPGVFSRATLEFTTFTETVVSDVPAYQRRRKRGVGS